MRSDVGAEGFNPLPQEQVHVEWGQAAARLAAGRGDAVVIVDVLSFSTTLTVAAERGCACVVHSDDELAALGGREAAAASLAARALSRARRAGPGEVSLSPASILAGARPGERLLVTSLNGAACLAAAADAPRLAAGCLRNAHAVAGVAAGWLASGHATRVTLVACGERWPSVAPAEPDDLRPGLEDWAGAGAIAAALRDAGLSLSVEAQAATLLAGAVDLAACVSARELVAAGFAADVELCLARDATGVVPVRSEPGGRTLAG
jgi:2-phosphosulfolactate phosphatase